MRYQIVRFDNSDGNYTGNPTVIASGLTQGEARKMLETRKRTAIEARYIMRKDR